MSEFVIQNGILTEYTGAGGTVVLPGGITSVGPFVFQCRESITGAVLSDGVRSVGTQAFWSCENLTSVTLPEGLHMIGDWAFRSG